MDPRASDILDLVHNAATMRILPPQVRCCLRRRRKQHQTARIILQLMFSTLLTPAAPAK